MLSVRRVVLLAIASAAIGSMCIRDTSAGKPAPPPPPPPPAPAGTLFYRVDRPDGVHLYGMQGDGTGKTDTGLPMNDAFPEPSNLIYGTHPVHDRWFLLRKEVDRDSDGHPSVQFFAVKNFGTASEKQVQLTDFFRYLDIDETISLTANPVWARWSNDGKDTFIALKVNEGFFDGPDATLTARCVYRLSISGADLEEAANNGRDFNLKPDSAGVERLLEVPVAEGSLGDFDFAPTNDRFVCMRGVPGPNGWESTLTVFQIENGAVTSTYPIAAPALAAALWSPDADEDRLTYVTSLNEIWTIGSDGTGAVKVLAKTSAKSSTQSYDNPIWSPDGSQLAHIVYIDKARTRSRWLARTPAGGGTPVILTNDLAPSLIMGVHRWVSNVRWDPEL